MDGEALLGPLKAPALASPHPCPSPQGEGEQRLHIDLALLRHGEVRQQRSTSAAWRGFSVRALMRP